MMCEKSLGGDAKLARGGGVSKVGETLFSFAVVLEFLLFLVISFVAFPPLAVSWLSGYFP